VFCFNADDGKLTAHEAFVGQDARSMRDSAGKSFGSEMLRDAQEGHIRTVDYLMPIPGSTSEATRRAFFTRIANQVCGVSAYLLNDASPPTQ
jgi:hypothetical protein